MGVQLKERVRPAATIVLAVVDESSERQRGDNRIHTTDDLAGDFDIFLASHEHQNIPRRKRKVDLQYLLDRTIYVILARGFCMEYLNWESTTRDGECGCIAIELGEL